jgi:hypothetical protein
LKLSQLLAQFLYTNKKLDLEGIGTFTLNSYEVPEADSGRTTKSEIQGTITFENNPATQTDPELISFISMHSGKMKALATSDLESHLELAQQFMNIGKPFIIDGVGTITKTRDAQYQFSPGNFFAEKIKDKAVKEHVDEVEEVLDFKSVFLKEPKKIDWRKPAIALFIILGLGLVVLGGYLLYKKTSRTETESTVLTEPEETKLVSDSNAVKPDTTPVQISAPAAPVLANYKFVLDNFKKLRAIQRFDQLKKIGWPVQMETKDSVDFKLYILMPVATTDSTRARDSLTLLNGRRVYIEN